LIEGGGTPAQAVTRNPLRRNKIIALGRCMRSLTSSTERKPRAPSSRAVSRAFSNVLRDPVSISSASSGTPQTRAARRMISASATGPAPPPDNTKSGAAACRNSSTPRPTRRFSAA
jgi:hypothetical protein